MSPSYVFYSTRIPRCLRPDYCGAANCLTVVSSATQMGDLIADLRMPKEVGWFIPPQPAKRIGVMPKTKLVQQTKDVLVDRRGNFYITDKQWGLFVLRYTGLGEPAPRAK
jgi:hypothetical protein